MPLLKTPLLFTFSVPVLSLAAPMFPCHSGQRERRTRAGDRQRAAVALGTDGDARLVPVTVAPLWMLRMPVVPATPEDATLISQTPPWCCC